MSFMESLTVCLFGLAIVFVVLISLCGIVVLQTRLVGVFSGKRVKPEKEETHVVTSPVADQAATEANFSAGELKLIDVDERTAAMIMAIVSHESQIPLPELQFRYIKAIEQ